MTAACILDVGSSLPLFIASFVGIAGIARVVLVCQSICLFDTRVRALEYKVMALLLNYSLKIVLNQLPWCLTTVDSSQNRIVADWIAFPMSLSSHEPKHFTISLVHLNCVL